MPMYKSPGQKRKGIVRLVSLLIFAGSTYGASLILGFINTADLAWVETHQTATATVTELRKGVEEYRNLKGRKRTRENYYVSYVFTIDGKEFTNTVEAGRSAYDALDDGGSIEVWYAEGQPDVNDIGTNMESAVAGNNVLGNMMSAVPFTGPACLILYWLLGLVFVRESKRVLPDGFYTETSWLDIDDRYVVALDESDLVYFSFNERLTLKLQSAYQNGAPLDELIALSKAQNVKRIPLGEVSRLVSAHNSDVIVIAHNNKRYTVEFLNQAVKAHALEKIRKLLPTSIEYAKSQKTRLQAALPALIVLMLSVGLIYWLDVILAQVVVGLSLLIWTIPRIISRLIDPTITESWGVLDVEAANQAGTD